jgi:WD40 repeat protein/serine/threonine protein kinase
LLVQGRQTDAKVSIELPISEGSTGFPPGPGQASPSDTAAESNVILPQARIGEYLILERLSRGGMGVVYKARHRTLGRMVALKTLLTGQLASEEERERFRIETEAAAKLDHPHIVPIYDVGEHEGQPYFAMRLVEGTNLARWNAEEAVRSSDPSGQVTRGKDWLRRCVRLVAAVASAVHHAHQREIIHRDLKPSNILVDPEGKPYVTDFGLARLLKRDSDLTLSGATIGTPSYMSPEQAQGLNHELTTATDIFSLGAILYELLTGELAFKGESPLETVKQVLEAEPRRPGLSNQSVDRDLETICLKCLEKDPLRRYASAADLADELGHWLNHEPIRARPASAPERLQKWARRRPLRAALAGFLLLSLVGFAITNLVHQFRVQQERDVAQGRLVEALLREGEAYAANQRMAEAKQKVLESRALAVSKRLSTVSADLALLDVYRFSPPPLLTLRGHTGTVTCVSVSLDERMVYSGGNDGTIRSWSLPLGRQEHARHAHSGGVSALVKSPDGRMLISAGVDGRIRLWDSGELNERKVLTNHVSKITALAFAGSGELFASASEDGMICIHRTWTGEALKVLQTEQRRITGITFTPDESMIIAVSEDGSGLVLRNVDSPSNVRSFSSAGRCRSLAASADGEQLVIANSAGRVSLRKWDGRHEIVPLINLSAAARSLAISASRERVFVGSEDGSISTWNYKKAEPMAEIVVSDHPRAVTSLALLAKDRLVVSASEDGTIRIWDTRPQQIVTSFAGGRYDVMGTAISPDGLMVLSAELSGSLRLWDIATGRMLRNFIGHEGTVFDADFSADGRIIASVGADGSLRIWDWASGNQLHRFETDSTASGSNSIPVKCVAFLPGGQLVVAGEGAISGEEDAPAAHGSLLHVWNTRTGSELTNFVAHRGGVLAVAVSADGRTVATGGGDGKLSFWDTVTWREKSSVFADAGQVNAVALDKQGLRCVSAGSARNPVLWDVASGQELRAFDGLSRIVLSVALSPDEKLLLGGLSRGELKIWDFATGKELQSFAPLDPVDARSVSFTPQGRKAIAAGNPLRLGNLDWITELQQRELAAGDARRLLQSEPANGLALTAVAGWYEFRGVWDWAAELYRRAREQGAAVSALSVARCLWQQNLLEEAYAEMSDARAKREAPEEYLDCCLSAIRREIQSVPSTDLTLHVPALSKVFPAVGRIGKDIWTTSQMALAELTETPGGGRADERLLVGGWGDEYHSLIQLDLAGLPTRAASSTLCLFCYDTVGESNVFYLDRITADWDWRDCGTGLDRERLWWADKPPTVQWAGQPLPRPVPGHWYKVDITALYNAWQRGEYPNYGLQLRPVRTVNENFNRFHSSRYTNDPSLQPKLVIIPND